MSEQNANNQQGQEVDLSDLFKIFGKGIKSIFNFIGVVLYNIFAFFILILLFIKKNIIVLLLAAIAGFAAQIALDTIKDDTFVAEAIIETNYQTEFQLRSRIDELNQLINDTDTTRLAQLLNIDPSIAGQLSSFEISPFYSNNKLRFDYYEHVHQKDTAVQNLFTYETYESNMRFEDYDNYEIKAFAKKPDVFNELNDVLWDFSDLEYVKKRRARERDILLNRKRLLENSFNSIDSTRRTIREVLIKEAQRPSSASSTQIDLGVNQGYKENPEVYEYEQALTKDIVKTIEYLNQTDDIVNVIKRFPANGRVYKVFEGYQLTFIFVGLTALIILLFRLSKYLARSERDKLWKFKKL